MKNNDEQLSQYGIFSFTYLRAVKLTPGLIWTMVPPRQAVWVYIWVGIVQIRRSIRCNSDKIANPCCAPQKKQLLKREEEQFKL